MKFRVDIIECERGWGRKVDEIKYFDDANEAYKFVEEFNAKNNLPYVPDWYMYAEEPVRVQ
jgi:hypothetical protein